MHEDAVKAVTEKSTNVQSVKFDLTNIHPTILADLKSEKLIGVLVRDISIKSTDTKSEFSSLQSLNPVVSILDCMKLDPLKLHSNKTLSFHNE